MGARDGARWAAAAAGAPLTAPLASWAPPGLLVARGGVGAALLHGGAWWGQLGSGRRPAAASPRRALPRASCCLGASRSSSRPRRCRRCFFFWGCGDGRDLLPPPPRAPSAVPLAAWAPPGLLVARGGVGAALVHGGA